MSSATEARLRRPETNEQAAEPTKDSNEDVDELKRNKFAAVHAELQAATSSSTHRLWTRTVVVLSVMTLFYFYTKAPNREMKFALGSEDLPLRVQKFACDEATFTPDDLVAYPACVPKQCGRFVMDQGIDPQDARNLLDLPTRIFNRTIASGGVSIFDMITGEASNGTGVVSVFQTDLLGEMEAYHANAYNAIRKVAKRAISAQFNIELEHLYYNRPVYFSLLTNVTAKSVRDAYWNEHIDTETYPSTYYTAVIYLNTYGKDFEGGRLIFVDGKNKTAVVEPKEARLSAFTSGAENRHYVEQVTSGERYTVTFTFTCKPNKMFYPDI